MRLVPALTACDVPVSVQWVTNTMDNAKDIEPAPYVIPLSRDGREALSFEPRELSGWGAYFSDDVERAGMTIFIRIGPRSNRTETPEIVFVDGRPGVRMTPPKITAD